MDELRLGDVIDDYCIKCRRLTNHAIVSLMEGEVAKVRCRSCYHDHNYLHEQAPPSKKDLKKAELFNTVLATVDNAATGDTAATADTAATVDTDAPPTEAAPAESPEPERKQRKSSSKKS